MVTTIISWLIIITFIASLIFGWEVPLIVTAFILAFLAAKGADEREVRRDRERRCIRDDD